MDTEARKPATEDIRGSRRERRRTVIAASAGNFAEWYDWGIYGVVATVIAQRFFPHGNAALAILGAYAVFAIAYLTRPLGTMIFGHIADSLGRKKALSVTIVFTCAATALIGFIPAYETIGVAAPLLLLLLRLIQSLGTGGEHATAIAFVYEHGPRGGKAKAVGVLNAMTLVGLLFGTLLATGISAILPPDAWTSWGWRTLFWLSLPMGLIGLYVRRHTEDGEEFQQLQRTRRPKATLRSSPVLEAIRTSWRKILLFVAFLGTWSIVSATVTSYLATFLKTNPALSQSAAYGANTTASATAVLFVLAFAPFVDRLGLRRATILACTVVAVVTVPGFILAGNGLAGAYLGAFLLGATKGMLAVPSLLAVSQIFPARIRVSAGGLSYNIAASALGGTAPLVAVGLNEALGSPLAFSSYIALAAVITIAIMLTAGRRWITASAQYSGDAGLR
ncbi:MFS transporter [Sciscionella sediminilitoris]|uniref:MFS transporter n=1 Tax=Sciscionella sediminilitoris TaxID=1445613 RepID=UPI0006913D1C|nr:MFS transporter [Sciscionella sp. SE31]